MGQKANYYNTNIDYLAGRIDVKKAYQGLVSSCTKDGENCTGWCCMKTRIES